MASVPQDLWFSDGDGECPYNRPSFYDSKDFPQLREIEENWQVIRDEILEYLKSADIPAYLDKSLIKGKNSWKKKIGDARLNLFASFLCYLDKVGVPHLKLVTG